LCRSKGDRNVAAPSNNLRQNAAIFETFELLFRDNTNSSLNYVLAGAVRRKPTKQRSVTGLVNLPFDEADPGRLCGEDEPFPDFDFVAL
jgi:hypothetical protein